MNTLLEKEQTSTNTPHEADASHGRHRFLIATIAVLAVALIGLAAWVVYDNTQTPATNPSGDVTQLLDDYNSAWNNHDGDAFLALVTDGYVLDLRAGDSDATETAAMITSLETVNWNVDVVGEPIMAGSGPWYVSTVDLLTANDYPPNGIDGISTYTIVDVGGTLKVSQHVFFGM